MKVSQQFEENYTQETKNPLYKAKLCIAGKISCFLCVFFCNLIQIVLNRLKK